MSYLHDLLQLIAIPFMLCGVIVGSVLITVIAIMPFWFCMVLCLYRFNLKEMLRMEMGFDLETLKPCKSAIPAHILQRAASNNVVQIRNYTRRKF